MDYLKYVNIKQGTKSSGRFSNGNTLPLVQRPFGFASFAPQTDGSRGAWFYLPDDNSFEGFRLTHQPSPWIRDYGTIVIHPQNEIPYMAGGRRWSSFDKEKTVLMPHYMKYHLNRSQADFELTPTTYGACMRITFGTDFDNYISVLPVKDVCGYEFDKAANRLYCYTDCLDHEVVDAEGYRAYFVLQFEDGAISAEKTLTEDKNGKQNALCIEGEDTAIHLRASKKEIVFTMAASHISYEQAAANLENDSGFTDFDSLKEENAAIWNEYLGKIEISGSEDILKTFYSCMYRVFLFPHKAYEISKNGEIVHYSPADGSAKTGYRYTDNGFWDTYRTVYPLLSIIAKDECREMIEGFINDYKERGWLPCWTALNAANCMPSTLIDAVIADAAVKGIISGELLETALEGMEKHANEPSPVSAYGRAGCEYYTQIGYVPCDKHKESVNLTLDAAYGDYCIAVVADILGYRDKAKKYKERSKNYKNIFDKETGFMRGRRSDGAFRPDFDPILWGRDYTEAAAWQTTFAVQHDFEGLAELYGGTDKLIKRLDEFFATPPAYRVGGYCTEIHEMSEFAEGNWGQCAISNQPSFHIPFIYAHFGETEKTDYWVKRMCDEAFSFADDGFPGDEDNGTMAAWYIFAKIGIYPLCPGKAEYIVWNKEKKDIKVLGKNINYSSDNQYIKYEDII